MSDYCQGWIDAWNWKRDFFQKKFERKYGRSYVGPIPNFNYSLKKNHGKSGTITKNLLDSPAPRSIPNVTSFNMRKNRSGKWKTFWWNYTVVDENVGNGCQRGWCVENGLLQLTRMFFSPISSFFSRLHTALPVLIANARHLRLRCVLAPAGVYGWVHVSICGRWIYLSRKFFFLPFFVCVRSHHVINRVINEHYRKFIWGDKGAIRCLRIVVCRFA